MNAALFGMPAVTALPAILVKSALLAGAAGYAARRFNRVSVALLAAVVLFYQIVGSAGEWALTGSFTARRAGFPDRDSRHVIAGVRRIPLYKVRNTQIAMMKKICMISFVLHFAAAGSGCASGNDKKAAEAAPAQSLHDPRPSRPRE